MKEKAVGKMPKVLHIGYGVPPVWQEGELYKIGLMRELARQGWAVTAFLAGRYDFKLRPYLRYSTDGGIRFIELRILLSNSSIVSLFS